MQSPSRCSMSALAIMPSVTGRWPKDEDIEANDANDPPDDGCLLSTLCVAFLELA